MTREERHILIRKLKRRRIIAWSIGLGGTAISWTIGILFLPKPPDTIGMMILLIAMFIIPLFTGLILGTYSRNTYCTLIDEMKRLKENRMKNYVRIFWEMLQRREYEEAKGIYNEFLGGYYRYVCNGLFTGFAYLDGSPEDYKQALERMSDYIKPE